VDEDVSRGLPNRDDGYHVLRWQQLRVWGFLNLDQVHQFYARGKLDYWDWNQGTSYDHNDSDWEGMNLERGWYDFKLSRARKVYGWDPSDFDLQLRLGRQYVQFGTGLALSIPLDAVLLTADYQGWQLTGLGAQSIESSKNIDRSIPDETNEERCFWGLQLRYNGWRDHEPFVYYFEQTDKNGGMEETITLPDTIYDQKFGYDSQYAGLGSRGRFFHRDLQYTCEFVTECGKSYAFTGQTGGEHRDNIHAWAVDTELRYVPRDRRQSEVALEYLLTSGDPDRFLSPTNTLGGNRPGTTDLSFSAWGYRNTGLVLAPRMSNLGMVRVGASTFPANHIKMFRELRVGTNMYIYHKQQSAGAASDTLSTKDSGFLGSEVDIYTDWRITSDLAWTINYGVFWPGSGFGPQKDRHLLFTAVTVNF
jgi:Alginate export